MLGVGDITLTYNTGYMGCDHGMLFQEGDRKRRRRGSIIYGYYEQHPERDVTQKRNLFLPLPTVNGSAT